MALVNVAALPVPEANRAALRLLVESVISIQGGAI
jgi:hypothetical protein